MKLIYSKNRLGTILELSSYPLLLFRAVQNGTQRFSLFDLKQLKILTEINYDNEQALHAELSQSQLYVYNQNVLRKYSKFGEILAEISNTPYFSKGYIFKPVGDRSEQDYSVHLLEPKKYLYNIKGSYWNRFYVTKGLIILYYKLDQHRRSISIYDKKNGALLNTINDIRLNFSAFNILEDSEAYVYLFIHNFFIVKLSQKTGVVIWYKKIGACHEAIIQDGHLLIANKDGLFEVFNGQENYLVEKIEIPPDIKSQFGTSKIFRIGYSKDGYKLAFLDESQARIVILSQIDQEILSQQIYCKDYSIFTTTFKNLQLYNQKVIVTDFDDNVGFFDLG